MDHIEEVIDALTISRADGIGPATARKLIAHFGSASTALRAPTQVIINEVGVLQRVAVALKDAALRAHCQRDIEEAIKLGGRVIQLGDPDYPRRLLNCNDAPVVLFVVGSPELNARRMISVVGTRLVSDYGKAACEKIIGELEPYGCTIVSGLAYGVDICAHRAALSHNLPTIACMAHGIQRIYPTEHTATAKAMLENGGGWVTEFAPGMQPKRNNFPERNRIIGGLSDATIVIESGTKGGSMITARIAASYHREVFALPGHITERQAAGCNSLIRNMEAILLTHGAQVARELNWEKVPQSAKQLPLLIDLSPEERFICELLTEGPLHVDLIAARSKESGFDVGQLPLLFINLELRGLIIQLPGQRFRLR